jgi:predicted deacylase
VNRAVSHVHAEIPPWLLELVKARMERLVILGLEGRPLGRSMGEVVRMWAQIIAHRLPNADPRLDAPRIHAAFDVLEAACERWPAPKQFLDALPARQERMKLPPPPMTAEQKQRARAMLADIVRKMEAKP